MADVALPPPHPSMTTIHRQLIIIARGHILRIQRPGLLTDQHNASGMQGALWNVLCCFCVSHLTIHFVCVCFLERSHDLHA